MTTLTDGTTTVTPLLVNGWQTARPTRNVVHPIIDREAPEVTLRAAGLRVGTLEVVFGTLADALGAEALHAQAAIITLDDPTVGTMDYVAAGGDIEVELDSDTRRAWIVRVPFFEVTT